MHSISDITALIKKSRVIAAVRDIEMLKPAVESKTAVVFILSSTIFNCCSMVRAVHEKGKLCFVHADFIEGLSNDSAALEYIVKEINPTGIISAKPATIKHAGAMGIFTIQRFFLIDSQSYKTMLKTVPNARPGIIEIMPGVMPTVIAKAGREIPIPIIAGGLIETEADICNVINAGAVAASTGIDSLWNL